MINQESFAPFRDQRFIALTTFRKRGAAVMTPVWFIMQGDALVIWTGKDSGKAKRIRKNSSVELAPSSHSGKELGSRVKGMARIISGSDQPDLKKAFLAKYGWQQRLFAWIWKLQKHQHIYIEITPPAGSLVSPPADLARAPG
jgi:uncharacterized protein